METAKQLRVAERWSKIIAYDLFQSGGGQHAIRLVLELDGGRDGGGWAEKPAARRIAGHLARMLEEVTSQPGLFSEKGGGRGR